MVDYNPPDEFLTIYNPLNFFYEIPSGITQSFADLRYIKKAGDTATGLINFANGSLFNDGSNVSPIGFINDSNTGFYRIGADNLGLTCGGVKQVDISTTATTFTNPVLHPNGSISNCGISFSSEVSSGLYISGTGMFLNKGGSNMMKWINSECYSDKSHNFLTGSATLPSIKSASYPTTGCFFKSTPSFCISTNGSERVDISANGANFSGCQIQGRVGSISDPSWSFNSEQQSGVYRQAANNIRFSVASSDKWGWSSTTNTSYQNLSMNSNNITSAPLLQNLSGDITIECNTTGAGGNIKLSGGTGLLSGTAGGNSGQHLVLTINGNQYKIALLNV
jgi:hypothetical protein